MTDLLMLLAGSALCLMALPSVIFTVCILRVAWADLEEDKQ